MNQPVPDQEFTRGTRPGSAAAEITIYDLSQALKKRWIWLFGIVLVGLLLGLGYAFFAPQKYQSSVSMQMAAVANEPVELPSTLAEKLKLPLYYSADTYTACGLGSLNDPGGVLVQRLKPAVNISAPLVNITFESGTPEGAEKCLLTVVDYVRKNQAVLAEPLIASRKVQLDALRRSLSDLEKIRDELSTKISSNATAGTATPASAMLLTALSSANQETKGLIADIGKLELALTPTYTREVALATPIYTKNLRTASARTLGAIGIFSGILVLGLAALITLSAWSHALAQYKARTGYIG